MRAAFRLLLALPLLVGFVDPVVADCPSLNPGKNADKFAQSLVAGSILLFLGKIEHQAFIGNIKDIEYPGPGADIDITYGVEDVFKGTAGARIVLRTPFFCEACSISNEQDLKEALGADIGERVIVFVWDEIDSDGHKRRVVSGGCPASLYPDKDLVAALKRASHKSN